MSYALCAEQFHSEQASITPPSSSNPLSNILIVDSEGRFVPKRLTEIASDRLSRHHGYDDDEADVDFAPMSANMDRMLELIQVVDVVFPALFPGDLQ